MNQQQTRISLLIITIMPILVFNLTSTPTTAPNNFYSSAGSVSFITSPYYNTANSVLNPATITLTFSGRVQPTLNYQFGYSIQDINYEIVSNKLNYSLSMGTKSTSSATINFYTNNANKISSLQISYLIIEPLFGIYYFSFKWMTPHQSFVNGTAPYTETSTPEGPFNMASTFTVWATILGIDATLSANNEIDLFPTITVISSSSIEYKIQTISPTSFQLDTILIEAFVFDSAELQVLNRNALITVNTFSDPASSDTDATNSLRSFNALVGIVGFHITGQPFLQYSTTTTPNNTVSFASNYNFAYRNFNYMFATFAACPATTPYLLVSTKTCYDVCPAGYSTDTVYSECNYIVVCGDSIISTSQGCDDSNAISGDGCSSSCQVETNFVCNTVGGVSVCSLTAISISLQSIIKEEASNSLALNYKISPKTLPALQTLNWSAITSQLSALNLILASFSFDSSSGILAVNVQYQNNIEDNQLTLQLAFPSSAPFDLLGNVITSTTLQSTNNLSLQLYDQSEYQAGIILKYITLALTILSLLFYLLGYYSGKLISIELISVYQLAYFSLISTEKMSPGLAALRQLSYSTGYNFNVMSGASSISDRHFYFLNYNLNFVNCYNLSSIVIFVPLLIALVIFVVNKVKYSLKNNKLSRWVDLLRGEVTFYGVMFSCYPIFIALFAIMRHMSSGIQSSQIGLFISGCVFSIIVVVYAVLIYKYADMFGQFCQQIKPIGCPKFKLYILIQIQTVLIAAILVNAFIKYQLIVLMGILSIQLALIIIRQPYKQSGGNIRPILNASLLIVIQLFILLSDKLQDRKVSLYMPFAIAALLLIALAYNIYFYLQELRRTKCAQQSQNTQHLQGGKDIEEMMGGQRAKIKDLQSYFINQNNMSILDATMIADRYMQSPKAGKPTDRNLLTLREQLTKIKQDCVYPRDINAPNLNNNTQVAQARIKYIDQL